MTPASTATAATTTTAFAINAIALRFDPVTATLVTRAALGNIAWRNAALFAAITGTTTVLEPAHAESGLTFVRTLGLVARRQRLALRSACRTILARSAIAASATTTPATPLTPFTAGTRLDALARLDRWRDRLVTTLLARRLTRDASTRGIRRALTPIATSRGPLGTRRTTATALASTRGRPGSSLAIASAIPTAALTTTASAIPTTATTAPLGPSAAIAAHTAWLLGLLFADRTARTCRHAHAERTGTEAQKSRRSFLHHGDHCLGARQAQRRQSLVHGLLERSAFEDVAP
jgi:hypothetical protein